MKRKVLRAFALAGLLSVAPVFAQDGVNFSGTWVKDPQQSESLAQAAAVVAQTALRIVIEQSPDGVRVTRQRVDGQSDTLTYSFRQTRPALPTPPADRPAPVRPGAGATAAADANGASGTTDARAEWRDGGLILRTDSLVSGKTVTSAERLTMSPDSRQLTVETELMVHHGYEAAGVGLAAATARKTAKDVYTKQ